MSIYNALRSGVSALSANSSAMAVISDNIANVNTIGFKRGAAEFVSLLNGQSSGSNYNPGGVSASTRRLIDSQGILQATASSTDLAISGDGFFVVSRDTTPAAQSGGVAFTRAGGFGVDRAGYLVNTQNYYLQGWPVAANGTIDSSPTSLNALEPINVANVYASAEPTANVRLRANLNSNEVIYDGSQGAYALGALANGTITPDYQTSIEIFDSLGAARTVSIAFLKTAANEWQVEIYSPDAAAANGMIASGQVDFDTDASVLAPLPGTLTTPPDIIWNAATGAADQPIAFDLINTLTQFATTYSVTSVEADGVPPGDLAELRVDSGLLTATFSNGRSRALYQLPVATFLNPDALSPDRGGVFRTTLESGVFNLNPSNTGGAGEVKSSTLEASNVDLASEFTTMIVTQRAYSASSKVITTADEMLEELLRIKR